MDAFYTQSVDELEDAFASGTVSVVSSGCPRDVLIRAAELHLDLGPWYISIMDPFVNDTKSRTSLMTDAFGELSLNQSGQIQVSGYLRVSESLDYDVIRAFLRAGYHEEMDPSAAIQEGREDIVELFKEYGAPLREKFIINGSRYVDENGVVDIPDGVCIIRSEAFSHANLGKAGGIKELHLPESLEIISSRAFGFGSIDKDCPIVIPKKVCYVGAHAFPKSCANITFYDTIDSACMDLILGWFAESGGFAGFHDEVEQTVLDSKSSEIKFKRWLSCNDMTTQAIYDLRGGWLPGCGFDFTLYDSWYGKFKPRTKAIVAVNRLTWPIDLDDKTAAKYRTYLKKNADLAIDFLCLKDDSQRFAKLLEIGAVADENSASALERAKAAGSSKIVTLLEDAGSDHRDKTGKPEVAKTKLTPTQAVEKAKDALEANEKGFEEILRPVKEKIGETAKVELLEAASACSDSAALTELYNLFGSFEYSSNALALAIMAGRADNARVLLEHGASFEEIPSAEVVAKEFDKEKKKRFIKYLKFAYEDYRKRSKDSAAVTLEKADYAGAQLAYLFTYSHELNIPCTGNPSSLFPHANEENVTAVVLSLVESGHLSHEQASAFALAAYMYQHYDEARSIAAAFDGKLVDALGPRWFGGDRITAPSDWVEIDRLEQVSFIIEADSRENIAKRLSGYNSNNIEYYFITRVQMYHGGGKETLPLWASFVSSEMPAFRPMFKAAAYHGMINVLEKLFKIEPSIEREVISESLELAQSNGQTEAVAWLLEHCARDDFSESNQVEPID